LASENALNVDLVLFRRIGYLRDAERLSKLRSQRLDADIRQELMEFFPAFVARRSKGLG
jgi:hypothetical protein